jgi:hypothetical protein
VLDLVVISSKEKRNDEVSIRRDENFEFLILSVLDNCNVEAQGEKTFPCTASSSNIVIVEIDRAC